MNDEKELPRKDILNDETASDLDLEAAASEYLPDAEVDMTELALDHVQRNSFTRQLDRVGMAQR